MNDLVKNNNSIAIEKVLIGGDLSSLTTDQRLSYYKNTCESLGLNPLTKPFEYITLNGKLTLYARKDATDQLRKIHNVSITIVSRETKDGICTVTARASLNTSSMSRTDESIGAVSIGNLKGDALANAVMKCESKAKRRATLSICGLGMLDETEVETIPSAAITHPPKEHLKEPLSPKLQVERFNLKEPSVLDIYKPLDIKEAIVEPTVWQPSPKQRARLFAIANDVGWGETDIKLYLKECFGYTSTTQIKSSTEYEDICKFIGGNPINDSDDNLPM